MARADGPGWEVERPHHRTIRIVIRTRPLAAWRQSFLLRSDAHHDHTQAHREMEHRHLREAVERDAIILDCGDLFCAMQGKWDKRSDPSALREEYRTNYLDKLVSHAADLYGPYASHWAMMSPGNHETSIRKRHETDLTERLVQTLNDRHGTRIQKGAYNGWVQIRVADGSGKRGRAWTYTIAYHHGHGGGGPVTKGVIGSNRVRASRDSYDLEWSGHIHESWLHRDIVDSLPKSGVPRRRDVYALRTPGYKDEYEGGDGWHIERGAPPKPLGAWWLHLGMDATRRVLVPTFEEAR